MCQQFNLCTPPQIFLSGRVLLGMSQKDFEALSPEGGDTLFAQLQLWKTGRSYFLYSITKCAAFESYQPQHCPAGQGGPMTATEPPMPRNNWIDSQNNCENIKRSPSEYPPQQFTPDMQNMHYYNNGSFLMLRFIVTQL